LVCAAQTVKQILRSDGTLGRCILIESFQVLARFPEACESVGVAYLIDQHPKISHTFIVTASSSRISENPFFFELF
jgi:hypothetical protein